MTHPLTGQRSRREQIAELYDSHAAGLFVYCADQLGDLGSAADVLASVLTSAPEEPPRAALYAFARREIHRRDVVYAPPVVDPLTDPASALVERILRELRPQQREVLVLGHVCGLDLAELAWVLDVAPDTAEELALSAAHRFRQVLNMALAADASPVSKPLADVYGALAVAPLRDVLGRLPWPEPPGALRIHLAGSSTAEPAPLFTKARWPVPPAWPQPVGDPDPATTTGLFPRGLLTPPSPSHTPDHDATTTPMPKYREDVRECPAGPAAFDTRPPSAGSLAPFDSLKENRAAQSFEAFRPKKAAQPGRATPRGAVPGMGDSLSPRGTVPGLGEPPLSPRGAAPGQGEPPLSSPVGFLTGGDLLDDLPPAALPAPPEVAPAPPATGDVLFGSSARQASPLFTPRGRPKEPVYRMPPDPAPKAPAADSAASPSRTDDSPATGPDADSSRTTGTDAGSLHATGPDTPDPRTTGSDAGRPRTPGSHADKLLVTGSDTDSLRAIGSDTAELPVTVGKSRTPRSHPAAEPRSTGPKGRKPHPAKGRKKQRRRRHHDWAWELIGFLICVAIAMIVFFSVPMIITP